MAYQCINYLERVGDNAEGYSRADEMVMELHRLMEDAPDDRTRQEFKRFISKIETM